MCAFISLILQTLNCKGTKVEMITVGLYQPDITDFEL